MFDRRNAAAAAVAFATATTAAAQDPASALTTRDGVFEAGFEVFVGGLRVARLDSETAIDVDAYRQAIRFETAGVLAWFVDGRSEAVSTGGFDADGNLRAERLAVDAMWNDEARSYAIRFGLDGRVVAARFDPPIDATARAPVPEPLRRGPDPLSVVVAAARSAGAGGETSVTTYDGKRAMRFTWRCAAERETLENDVYAGPVVECAAQGEQIGGFHREYSKNNIQAPRPARVWLAPVDDGRFYAPVKLLMETQYGGLVASLTRVGPPPPPTD